MSLSGGLGGVDVVAVVCGPTGAGKSAIALRLAARHRRPILVADSRQIYRRFDLGTAKPTAEERRHVPHLGLDVVDPTDRYSAAQWADLAERCLSGAVVAGGMPLVVGGTGMYLRSLFEGLFAEPAVDERRRKKLLDWLDTRATEELRQWAVELDPARAVLGRTQLLRAVSVALLTGQRISRLHKTRAREPGWRPHYLVVDPGPALNDRIGRRLDSMIDAGWLEEVRALDGLPDDAPAWTASGYRTMRGVVRGTINLETARESILIETWQYAKRQRTWFRHQLPEARTTRVNPLQPDADDIVDAWWESVQPR